MAESSEIAKVAWEMEKVEDRLNNMDGMENYRERLTSLRSDMVRDELNRMIEDGDVGDTLLFDESENTVRNLSDE